MTTDQNRKPLESWKEIAAHLNRDVTTVRRWEKTQGLPVHRHLHQLRSSVFAHPEELDAWWASRSPADVVPPEPASRFRRLAAIAAALVLAAVTRGDAVVPQLEAPTQAQGVSARQLWTGPKVDTTGAIVPGTATMSYVDWETGDLAVRDLATGASRRLTQKGTWAESPAFALFSRPAPDGQSVAYAWYTPAQTWELRTVPIDGGAPRTLYAHADVSYVQPSGWSPDGKQVLTLFVRPDNSNQIALVSAIDGSTRILKSLDWRYPMSPVFSPDGRFVAFDFPAKTTSSERDIFLISSDGARETPLVQHPANDFLPAWSPDGTRVAFLSDRGGTLGLWAVRVRDGVAEGAPEQLKADIGRISSMAFDRNGSLHYVLETSMTDVYVAAVDFSAGIIVQRPAPVSNRFVGANRGADWSPDGRQISYLSDRGQGSAGVGGPTIIVRSLDTSAERELLPDLVRLRRPRWSPDGKRLLAFAHSKKGERGMYAIDPQTAAATLLFPLEVASYGPSPVWSHDSRSVFYTYPKGSEMLVRMHDLRSGTERILHRSNAQNLSVSPDGKLLAFTYPTGDKSAVENHLVVMALDSGTSRVVAKTRQPEAFALDGVTWTRDGRDLLYVKGGEGGPNTMWRVPAGGGDALQINIPIVGMGVGLSLHPDGRRIAFTSGERSAEVWVLENLLPSRR